MPTNHSEELVRQSRHVLSLSLELDLSDLDAISAALSEDKWSALVNLRMRVKRAVGYLRDVEDRTLPPEHASINLESFLRP